MCAILTHLYPVSSLPPRDPVPASLHSSARSWLCTLPQPTSWTHRLRSADSQTAASLTSTPEAYKAANKAWIAPPSRTSPHRSWKLADSWTYTTHIPSPSKGKSCKIHFISNATSNAANIADNSSARTSLSLYIYMGLSKGSHLSIFQIGKLDIISSIGMN